VAEWAVGQPPSVNQIVIDAGSVLVAAALPGGRAGAIYSNYTFSPPAQVLWLESTGFADGGYLPTDRSPIDPDYWTYGAYATPFAAAGEPSAGTAAILEYDGSQLLAFVWQLDLGAPQQIVVPSTEPPEGAIAVGICPKGYVYLATTIRGHVLLAEGTFDGGIGAVPSRYLTLPDFDPTPGLLQRDNSGIARPATSMALAPTPDGKLLLAISNPWQVAVYLEDCE
jgi:hypothetical protein